MDDEDRASWTEDMRAEIRALHSVPPHVFMWKDNEVWVGAIVLLAMGVWAAVLWFTP
jgi:hypothetical protein